MKKFILVHDYKYGQQIYMIEVNSTTATQESILDNIHSICDMLSIEFDVENETLSVHEMPEVQSIVL